MQCFVLIRMSECITFFETFSNSSDSFSLKSYKKKVNLENVLFLFFIPPTNCNNIWLFYRNECLISLIIMIFLICKDFEAIYTWNYSEETTILPLHIDTMHLGHIFPNLWDYEHKNLRPNEIKTILILLRRESASLLSSGSVHQVSCNYSIVQ